MAILAIVLVIALATVVLSVSVVSGSPDPTTPDHTHATAPPHTHFHTHSAIPHEHDEHAHDEFEHEHDYPHPDDISHGHDIDYVPLRPGQIDAQSGHYPFIVPVQPDDHRYIFTEVYDCEQHYYNPDHADAVVCKDPTNPNFEISIVEEKYTNTPRPQSVCHIMDTLGITSLPGNAQHLNYHVRFFVDEDMGEYIYSQQYHITSYGHPVLRLESISPLMAFHKLAYDLTDARLDPLNARIVYMKAGCSQRLNGHWDFDTLEFTDTTTPDVTATLVDNLASATFNMNRYDNIQPLTTWLYMVLPQAESCDTQDYDEFGLAYTVDTDIELGLEHDAHRVCFQAERVYTGLNSILSTPVYIHAGD